MPFTSYLPTPADHLKTGDGDGALAAGLGDDLGFSFMLFSVEDVVFHAGPAQETGKSFTVW